MKLKNVRAKKKCIGGSIIREELVIDGIVSTKNM